MTAHSPVRPISPYSGQCIEVTQYQPPWQALNDFAMNSNFDSDHMDTNNPEYKRLFHQVFILRRHSMSHSAMKYNFLPLCHPNRCTASRRIHVHIWRTIIISIVRMPSTISTSATIRTALTRWPRSWKVTRAAKRNSIQLEQNDQITNWKIMYEFRKRSSIANGRLNCQISSIYLHKNMYLNMQLNTKYY